MTYYALQDRIARLRAHIRRAGKRGDQQALLRLVQLRQELERCRVSSLKTSTLDLMLQELYDSEAVLKALTETPPWFAFIKKDDTVPDNRAYVVPISFADFLPEKTMPKAICPDCEQLIDVSPNGKDPATTNKRQRLDMHKKPPEGLPDDGSICPGSGKDV